MIKGEWMNVRRSERGSLLGIKIYSPIYECFIECVDIPEQFPKFAAKFQSNWSEFETAGIYPRFISKA